MTEGAPRVDLPRAAQLLAAGGVVAYPTETFYGLGARIDRADALRRISEIKRGRDAAASPFPVLCADFGSAQALAQGGIFPVRLAVLARACWPGALTVVVPARPDLPDAVAPGGTVGVRVSAHPVATGLAREVGPIIGTSANRTGESPSTRGDRVAAAMSGLVDGVLVDDAGVLGGAPSTVVGLADDGNVVVLRPGAVADAAVRAVLEKLEHGVPPATPTRGKD